MINQDKPAVGIPETYLNIGDGFNLLVGGIYKLIVGAASLGGITNAMKASIGTTWSSWTVAWDDETKTWDELSQLIENQSVGVAGALWSLKRTPWLESAPWLSDNGITNFSKP